MMDERFRSLNGHLMKTLSSIMNAAQSEIKIADCRNGTDISMGIPTPITIP